MGVWLSFVGTLAWLLDSRTPRQLEHALGEEAVGFDGK